MALNPVTLRIASVNLVDTGTVSASSAVATLPPSNVQEEDIQSIWRATSTAAQWLLVDLGATSTIGVVALINTSLGMADAVRVRVSTSDVTGAAGDAYDSGSFAASVDSTYAMLVHFIEVAVSGRYVRVDLGQSSVPEVGRWFVGRTWTPSRHFSFGWEPVWRDWSRKTYSLGQNEFIDERGRQRGFRFRLFGLTATEADDEVEMLNRLNGTSRDVLVCRDKEASNLGKVTVWGTMEDMVSYPQRHPDFYDAEFVVWNRL